MLKRTVRSDFGEVSIRQEGVVHAKVLYGVEIDLEKARTYHLLVEHLTKGNPHCTIIDLSGISAITPKAREFLQNKSSEWGKTIAVALVTSTFTARVLGNFFLTINKPSYPIKVFTDPLSAQHWAQGEFLKGTTRAAS